MSQLSKSPLNPSVTVAEQIAHRFAIASVTSNSEDLDPELHIGDIFEYDSDAVIWGAIAEKDADVQFSIAENFKDHFEQELKRYGDAVQRGLVARAIAGADDSDMNAIDIDSMARIGMNTEMELTMSGVPIKFDTGSSEWVGEDGKLYEMDFENGLPVGHVA